MYFWRLRIMASRKEPPKGKVLSFIKNVREYENGWAISASKMQWGDDAPTVNIRRSNMEKGIYGSGIAITDLETDILVDALLAEGYGTVEAIEEALNKRKNMFNWDQEKIEAMKHEQLN